MILFRKPYQNNPTLVQHVRVSLICLLMFFSDSPTKTRVHKYRFRVVDLSALAKFAPHNPQQLSVRWVNFVCCWATGKNNTFQSKITLAVGKCCGSVSFYFFLIQEHWSMHINTLSAILCRLGRSWFQGKPPGSCRRKACIYIFFFLCLSILSSYAMGSICQERRTRQPQTHWLILFPFYIFLWASEGIYAVKFTLGAVFVFAKDSLRLKTRCPTSGMCNCYGNELWSTATYTVCNPDSGA